MCRVRKRSGPVSHALLLENLTCRIWPTVARVRRVGSISHCLAAECSVHQFAPFLSSVHACSHVYAYFMTALLLLSLESSARFCCWIVDFVDRTSYTYTSPFAHLWKNLFEKHVQRGWTFRDDAQCSTRIEVTKTSRHLRDRHVWRLPLQDAKSYMHLAELPFVPSITTAWGSWIGDVSSRWMFVCYRHMDKSAFGSTISRDFLRQKLKS